MKEERKIESDYVFCSPTGGILEPGSQRKRLQRLLESCGMEKIRFHDLRGTSASLIAQTGTPKQLQEFLGHNRVSTTMEIYVKAFDSDRKAVAGLMGTILENALACSEKCSD